MSGGVHYDDPFADPPEARSPARLLRGRLPLPVSIWTTGDAEDPVGLTVSSVMVADGEPPLVIGLISPNTDLHDRMNAGSTFIVHVLPSSAAREAEIFAGLRPSPGGPFAGREIEASDWGPVLREFGNRAFCRVVSITNAGYHSLVSGAIEKIQIADAEVPLVFWRGRFRHLEERD